MSGSLSAEQLYVCPDCKQSFPVDEVKAHQCPLTSKTASIMSVSEIVAKLRERNEAHEDNFLLDLANRIADEGLPDETPPASKDMPLDNRTLRELARQIRANAQAVGLGESFHGGSLHGASVYNVLNYCADQVMTYIDAESPVETDEIRKLFNRGIGVQVKNKFNFSFETEEDANRAFHYIADLGTLETSRPPLKASGCTNNNQCRFSSNTATMCGYCQEQYRLSQGAALQDLAYYNGAHQAAAIAHQSLEALDKWLAGGCGNRYAAARAELKTSCCEPAATIEPKGEWHEVECKGDGTDGSPFLRVESAWPDTSQHQCDEGCEQGLRDLANRLEGEISERPARGAPKADSESPPPDVYAYHPARHWTHCDHGNDPKICDWPDCVERRQNQHLKEALGAPADVSERCQHCGIPEPLAEGTNHFSECPKWQGPRNPVPRTEP